MKTLVIDIRNPADGDEIILQYESPRGGKTAVKHKVVGPRHRPILDDQGLAVSMEPIPAQTPADIATAFGQAINTQWLGAFRAKVKEGGSSLIVSCQDEVSDVVFSTEVNGTGGTIVDMMEF